MSSSLQKQRPKKDEVYMKIATIIAKRSTCLRREVGAILVKGNHLISTGYNGSPSGLSHCTEATCVRSRLKIPSGKDPQLCRAVHAEINCLIQAAIHGTSIEGETTLYVTTYPCIDCMKVLINAGINRIVYLGEYDEGNKIRDELVEESKICIERFDEETMNLNSWDEMIKTML